ncbi:MAG: MoaD/ThiS family protein [Candidatus Rokubacteria bacterium]|nr:MoaD/ThiS family protein [Candidatus Rokubacteria bacterium]
MSGPPASWPGACRRIASWSRCCAILASAISACRSEGRRFEGLRGLVRNEQGEVHHHVNIYVNSEAIESLAGLATSLKDGDEVSIIPALAGGGPALAGGGTPSTRD